MRLAPRSSLLLVLGLSAVARVAGAQAPAAPSVAPPAGPPGAVVAEAPIVAGNVLGAQQRAMSDAFRQVVERSFAAILAETGIGPTDALPPALARLRASFASRAKRFVRGHTVVEQREEGGRLRVTITADVDEGALRREIDRARAGGAAPAPTPAGPTQVMISATPPEAGVALTRALDDLGIRAQALPPGLDEARASEAAGRGGATLTVVARGDSSPEGAVRGTTKSSVRCQLTARLLPAGGAAVERTAETRAFADRDEPALADCWTRAAAELARHVTGVAAPAAQGTGAGRAVTLLLDLVEPAALPLILQGLKKIGSVSSAEVRDVAVGRVHIRVATGLSPAALGAALSRAVATTMTATVREQVADRVTMEVRLLPAPVVPAPAAPASATPPPP